MPIDTPMKAVDLAKELGKNKRTIQNWLQDAYERQEGKMRGLRITKEFYDGNETYLVMRSDWEQFKSEAFAMPELPTNTHEIVRSTPSVELEKLFLLLEKHDAHWVEKTQQLLERAVCAEQRLKLLGTSRPEMAGNILQRVWAAIIYKP